MKKFFIPFANSPAEAEEAYGLIKESLQAQGNKISDMRIASISFRHEGKVYYEEVGEQSERIGETIIAIFRTDRLFLVLSKNRGIVKGEPMLVGLHEVTETTLFS
ncbi:hypothetical protein [Deminuibacter soli]|uniref:Uncharacterized protein n=1 Tax=Deminuibacter soli TaxID=2291815 RepID=A0A3E1NQ65_9BACT|nr:hypothetical protein [Deminuibacter soli]RFM30071.1 hypothetical protein DXN05_03605 [Deminuibacter soli]